MGVNPICCRLSPLNLVIDPRQDRIAIPWILEGQFILNLIGALCMASVQHRNRSLRWRLETAVTGLGGGPSMLSFISMIPPDTFVSRLSLCVASTVFVCFCQGRGTSKPDLLRPGSELIFPVPKGATKPYETVQNHSRPFIALFQDWRYWTLEA